MQSNRNNKQSKSKQVHKFFLWFDLIDFWCRCCTLVDKAKLNVDHRCLNHFSCAKTLQYGFKTDIKIISYSPPPIKYFFILEFRTKFQLPVFRYSKLKLFCTLPPEWIKMNMHLFKWFIFWFKIRIHKESW